VSSANWTTELLAGYLGQHTGIQITEEAVRVYCMRMIRLQATHLDLTTQSGRVGGLRGKRVRVEVLLAGATAPERLPIEDLAE